MWQVEVDTLVKRTVNYSVTFTVEGLTQRDCEAEMARQLRQWIAEYNAKHPQGPARDEDFEGQFLP